MSGKRVFLYVQHLLGIGHLKRASTLARALCDAGCEVTLATGGYPVPQLVPRSVRLVQLLPAGMAGLDFSSLLDEKGVPVDDSWKVRRRAQLLDAFRASRPHALLIELFPFGRRQMRFELLPLLEEARGATPRPSIVSSVRDVLGQRDPARQDEMLALFERYFDHVLVHGDPRFIGFDQTFRHTAKLGERLHYTGFVVERETSRDAGDAGSGEVIVSAGGGAVGTKLLETAIRARALSSLSARPWRLLSGVNVDAAAFDGLVRLAQESRSGSKIFVERSRDDFRTLLRNCALSVSQGGYNTVLEILDCAARAVVVPFAGGKETEQTMRANLLAQRGRIEIVTEDALTPATLAAAIDRAATRPAPGPSDFDLDGAPKSAMLLANWVARLSW